MELLFTEEKAKKLWSDPELLSLMEGCNHILATVTQSGKKHLVITPDSIEFDRWSVILDDQKAAELACIVDITPLQTEL
jgi:hypothetical protein